MKMKCFNSLVFFAVFCSFCSSSVNGQKDKPNNVVGAIWELTLSPPKPEESKVFRIRATKDYKVFLGPEEIGRWEKNGTAKVTIDFTTKRPLFMGSAVLNKSRNNPPTYDGKLKKADGTEVNAKLVMLED